MSCLGMSVQVQSGSLNVSCPMHQNIAAVSSLSLSLSLSISFFFKSNPSHHHFCFKNTNHEINIMQFKSSLLLIPVLAATLLASRFNRNDEKTPPMSRKQIHQLQPHIAEYKQNQQSLTHILPQHKYVFTKEFRLLEEKTCQEAYPALLGGKQAVLWCENAPKDNCDHYFQVYNHYQKDTTQCQPCSNSFYLGGSCVVHGAVMYVEHQPPKK